MASLWADIDAALVTLIGAAMGNTVVVADQIDPDNVALPVTLLRGNTAQLAAAEIPMMGYEYGLDGIRYAYELIHLFANDDRAAAKIAAADAGRTLRNTLLANPQLGLTATVADEYVHTVELTELELYVRGRAGQNQAGKYLGAAALSFDVVTVLTVSS